MNPACQIWAVGRNYQEHVRELGHLLDAGESPAEPMIFLKSGACCVPPGGLIHLPPWSVNIQHEVEIALCFGADLQFSEFTIALDLTARDIQSCLKSQGHPWTLAKSFKDACPLGLGVPISALPDGPLGLNGLEFSLDVNGERRQHGRTQDMIFKVPELHAYVISRFPVRPGDWLLTGTPAGVGPLTEGDLLSASIHDYCQESWTVALKKS